MVVKFPCKICNKAVANNHHAVQCDRCHLWVHIKCNRINLQTYKYLQKCSYAWYCPKCYESIIPFTTISNEELYQTNQGRKIKFTAVTKKASPNQDLIDQFNDAMDDPMSGKFSTKYYEPHELTPLMETTINKLSFLHLNISSLCYHIEEPTTLLSEHKLTFDIIGISESRLKMNKINLNSVQIPGYNFEFTPTECNNGGTALYIKKGLHYKLRNDLQIYKSKELESTFIEITQNKKITVVGCIYRHPSMELSEFNSDYLANLLEKLSVENKTLVLLGDFNADLLKYHTNSDISNFLDSMYSSLLLPHIASPTRTTATSATLIDNIFSNNCNSPYTSGNLVITLSDHHAQFLILGNQHNSIENNKEEQLYRDFQEIEKKKDTISEQLENFDWKAELRLERNNVNLSSELLIIKVNKLINFWAPLQKVSNKRKKSIK